MPTRLELDEHRLTPEHLRNVRDRRDAPVKPRPELILLSTLAAEMTWVKEGRTDKVSGFCYNTRI